MGNLNRHTLNDLEISWNSSLPMDEVIHYFFSQIRRKKVYCTTIVDLSLATEKNYLKKKRRGGWPSK